MAKKAKATKQRLDESCWKGYRKSGTKVKGKSFVKREPVTDELWQKHLELLLKLLIF